MYIVYTLDIWSNDISFHGCLTEHGIDVDLLYLHGYLMDIVGILSVHLHTRKWDIWISKEY